ncbi:hypothetical protein IEQ34_003252 [Dendrobium chrysotoxum]|uniref:Uncharacterized protein n=1 Tax=Dendrobium chrysotoxum TaxID=161865 RepID=A0AAV7HJ61_DENCH|nr:hypothetical protein IEQ34_003252 [Dendrobium chrysotoxum]
MGHVSSVRRQQEMIQSCELLAEDGLTLEDGNMEANERVFSMVMGPEHPGRVRIQGTNEGRSSGRNNLSQLVNLKEEVNSLCAEMRAFMQQFQMQHPPTGSSQTLFLQLSMISLLDYSELRI